MASTSPPSCLTSNCNCPVKQALYLDVEENWDEDFAFEQDLTIPLSLVETQETLYRDRKCILHLASKMQELKNAVYRVQAALNHSLLTNPDTSLARDLQLSRFLIEVSENPSQLSELPIADSLLCNKFQQTLLLCDLKTWKTLEDCSTSELEKMLLSHPIANDFALVPDVQWIDQLTLKMEILQSRIEKYLTQASA